VAAEAHVFGYGLSGLNHRLDDFEEQQDENDGKDEADAATTVVSETWTHAVTTEAEQQNQNKQNEQHLFFSHFGERSPFALCDADFVGYVMF
jgi:hypothetical protein